MSSRALGIMGKAPDSGAVKTRLRPPLTPDETVILYRAFLRDAMLTALAVPDCTVRVIVPPGEDISPLRGLAPAGIVFDSQPDDGLGPGMRDVFLSLKAAGTLDVVLIGSDIPTLPASYIQTAFLTLESEEYDLVLGPARDGGYYLIGLREDHPELFDGPDWGTSRVLEQTLERASQSNLRVRLLPEWYDIDDGEDLGRLVEDLGRDGRLAAPATRAALQTLRRLGAAVPESTTPWKVNGRQIVHESRWRRFLVEHVETHAGEMIDYTYSQAPDAVWVVPVTRDGNVLLVRQYRHPIREWALEVPAGGVDGRPPRDVAIEELREEIGGQPSELHYIGMYYTSTSHLSHLGYVYLALDVELGETDHETTELLFPVRIPAELAFDMARRGEISDGQSALALLSSEQAVVEWLRRETAFRGGN